MKKRIIHPIGALVVVGLALVASLWIHFGLRGTAGANAQDDEAAIPASAAPVKRGTLTNSIRLTAEFRAYQEIDVHAKVAGFIQSIPVDIGDQVKQGGIIATLEIPELDQDLKKAAAGVKATHEEVNKAQADYAAAHSAYVRLQSVGTEHPKFVAQQDIDDLRAKDGAAAATLENAKQHVEQAEAEQSREMALVNYSKITAPFDGVVTKRFADTGALIEAGTSSTSVGTAVVRFAQENVLRVVFPVPESAVASVELGAPVRIEVTGMDRTLQGSVTRFSKQLDPEARTMETEADIPNPDLSINPGMYGWADLILEELKDVLYVPVVAISTGEQHAAQPVEEGHGPWPVTPRGTGEKATVYLITKDNKIEERAVVIGLQTPNQVEILSGLQEGDLVFIGHRSQVLSGELVKPQVIEAEQTTYTEKK